MANQLVWHGMDEFRAQLTKLPDACTVEASHLIEGAANGVYIDIRTAYPARTGNLRQGMSMAPLRVRGQFIAGAIVRNRAPHALLFEHGTQARHNALGANRGAMPAGKVFVPRIVAARRRLVIDLKLMVARHGATVTGNA